MIIVTGVLTRKLSHAAIVFPVNLLSRKFSISRPNFTEMSGYSVDEVKIPIRVPGNPTSGHIAGRLFQGSPGQTPGHKLTPVICVHGWGDTAASFDPILPLIVKGRNLTALSFDMTGHGKSSHSPGPYTNLHQETLLTILRLIRHYKWDKITLMGHSFGGLVSLAFASTFPELVHGFVALDIFPPLAFQNDHNRNILDFNHFLLQNILDLESKMATSSRSVPEYTREEMIDRMMQGRIRQGGLTREGCDMLVDRGSIVQPNGKLRFSHDPRGQAFFFAGLIAIASNVQIFAQGIKCPTILVNMGVTSDPRYKTLCSTPAFTQVVPNLVESIRKNVPRLESAHVECTHHGHMLNPELVSPIIISFLESNVQLSSKI